MPLKDVRGYRGYADELIKALRKLDDNESDFSVEEARLSGSLAKGTSLKGASDIDIGCYIKDKSGRSKGINDIDAKDAANFLERVVKKLQKAVPEVNFIELQEFSIKIEYKGMDVDFVPILYNGDPDLYGEMRSKTSGKIVLTCIPRHIEFVQTRKDGNPIHYAQVIRLLKYWVKKREEEDEDFQFKSIMIELIVSYLLDKEKISFEDYTEALQNFFTYIIKSELKEKIFFNDYPNKRGKEYSHSERVQIIDPIDCKNNVAMRYHEFEANKIISAAENAGDSIDAAYTAIDKNMELNYWREVFGNEFDG